MSAVQFGVLGPLAVTTDAGEPVVVPGTKVRALLADLLTNRNQVVSADRLIDDLWGDDSPANPAGALQVRVSQLRKALNDAEPGARELVESRPPGYLLRADAVDADRFAELTRSTDVDRLTDALALWRGEAYADVADAEFVRAEATRLAEQRLAVHERLAEARVSRGEHDLVAADLAELVARHPLREGLRAVQLRALYAAGRQSEALDSYADLRDRLAEEMGLDPGPELVALHRRILEQDAGLSAPPKAALIRNSLPAQLDELVGRAEALTELRALLPRQRLVTLVGPGGVGKTRLATEAARTQSFPDGIQLVELAPLPAGDPRVGEQVLGALDAREAAGTSLSAADRLVAALRHRHLLLVLDNCEHVIEPVAALVARLLRDAPEVSVLATSREPLGLTGELLWEVPPLTVPDGGDLDTVRRSAAARLFAARAAAQQRGFRLDGRTAPAVAQLCRRLDGLPLALELAATRVRALGLRGVVDRLDDRFRLLSTSQRDVPTRQRTLTAVIGWSWDLLDEADRMVLARLAVFSDGATPEAAERVCGTDLDALARLVDRSLVVLDDTGEGSRYRLLESVAAFCLDRLGDADEVRARHAAYYTELAERADPELRGPEQQRWLALLDAETANLRSALVHGGGLRLAVALSWYWYLRGRLTEARRALAMPGDGTQESRAAPWRVGFALLRGDPVVPAEVRAALAPDPDGRGAWFAANAVIGHSELALAAELLPSAPADVWTEAAVLASRAMLAHAAGDQTTLEYASTRSAALFADIGDRWGRLQATEWVGGLAEMRGEHERAVALHREGLRWAEELALWPQVCTELSWLAWLAVQTRDYPQGRELAERAYRLAVEQDAPGALVFAEMGLGFAARHDGKLDLAVTHLTRLAERGRGETQPALYLPMILVELGYAVEQGGDPDAALALHVEAYEAAEAMASPRDGIGALEGMASAVRSPEAAARLLGAAAAARLTLDAPASPAERDETDRVTERVRATLGRDRFEALVAEGTKLGPGEARAQL
ncbi:BTAD domain-containing putative transcriptional regulator [Micromonospora sp. WMMD710]|uniref:BTAD domain-containing putative transcriptional regulator n=1 Tax=Micromonospora sp. WMMD710 TaxID=3016085 RepID=UPI002416347C|nr:BTAD domain-containing putative transcriptional regulator [Micromonospora sp. WMMD710]MDG4757592.1 BTAD domain-containing putative transcriptional regulator [Micromonospora sp. WMMD710]